MTRVPPHWLSSAGRWLLRRRFDEGAIDEIEGDVRELWQARAVGGRRDLRRAYIADIAGVLWRRPVSPLNRTSPRADRGALGEGVRQMFQDLGYAVRIIRRQPQLALVTILTLALGVAAATSIFSAVERLLLRPLPYPDPGSIVMVDDPPYSFGGGRMGVAPSLHDLGIFAGAGLYAEGGLNIGGADDPQRVPATVAEPGFFDALGVPAAMGRPYTTEEDVVGANTVAVISDRLWRRLGADPGIVNSELLVNARPFRVTGVMPPDFHFPGRTDIWIPVASDRQTTGEAFAPSVVARLAPGLAIRDAEVRLDQFNQSRTPAGEEVEPSELTSLQESLTAGVRPLMLLLAVAVALLLIVTCSNVASLLLSKVARRRQEFALRRALGGTRWRLARLLLAESVVLTGTAGVLGVGGAILMLRAMPWLLDQPLPGVDLSGVDPMLLLIALSVSVGTGVLFSLAPGVAASAQPASQVVRGGSTVAGGRGWRWFRGSLVVLQIAVALVLLTVTGAAAATMLRVARVDLGFGNAEAIGFQVTLPMERYEGPEQVMQFYREATERLRAVPGVRQVGATGVLPGSRAVGVGLRLTPPGLPEAEAQDYPFASMLFGSPDYFGALGIPILRGRSFLPADTRGAPRVTILSESAAQALWPDGREPVGQVVEISGSSSRQLEVVGVVADVLMRGPEGARGRGQFYQPMLQATPFGSMAFVVDAGVSLGGLTESLRSALAEVDPSLPPYDIRPVQQIADGFLSTHRLATTLMGGFAVMTLLLASVALYGVLAQLVTQRTRELGIRIALGADGGRLLRGVVGEGLRLAVVGIVAGAAAAGVAARLMAAFVPALDPPSWPAIALDAAILLAVAALASWIPARRAALTDPLVALRQE